MFKKILWVGLGIVILMFLFSGYSNEYGIDNMAYVVAIGLDKSKDNDSGIRVSIQISIPESNSSGGSSSGGGSEGGSDSSSSGGDSKSQSKDTILKTVDASSLTDAFNTINNMTANKLNFTHCKLIIFSEELAKDGIYKYIDTLANNRELRSNCNVVVAKSDAKDFLEAVSPKLEKSTSKYYETLITASDYTAYTANITLNNFASRMKDTFSESAAILRYYKRG